MKVCITYVNGMSDILEGERAEKFLKYWWETVPMINKVPIEFPSNTLYIVLDKIVTVRKIEDSNEEE